MKRIEVISIDVAAYLVARGRDAIVKAMQRGRLKESYVLKLGETTTTLLSFDEVHDLWLEEGLTSWRERRYEDVTREHIVITTMAAEWVVYLGEMAVYNKEFFDQRIADKRKKLEGEG